MRRFILSLLLLPFTLAFAQTESGQPLCYIVGKSKTQVLDILRNTPKQACYEDFARMHLPTFQGVPYGEGSYGLPARHALVNVTEMNCVTFVENFLAIAMTHEEFRHQERLPYDEVLFNRYIHYLNKLRYYDGINRISDDRIHYFTDCMRLLCKEGVMEDIGKRGGEPFTKRIHYISSNRNKFRGIQSWEHLKGIESAMSNAERYYYPLDSALNYLPHARTGDIVGMTSTVDGLDVSHVGVISVVDGELRITHASSVAKQIVLEKPFIPYLKKYHRILTGFVVYRPRFS